MSSLCETLFGIVPNDWNINKIGEIFSLSQGLQISSKKRISFRKKNYIPLLKITDLPHKNFSEFVTNIEPQYIASYEDIIYTRTGNVGLVYTDIEGCVHNNCFKVNFDKNLFDKYYIYYYLKSKQVFTYSNQVASGSVQRDLTHPSFNSCIFAYPKLEKQKKIGKILKNFDDKIELNNQMNQTLESMSSALFKEWFENFNFPNDEGKAYKENGGEFKASELGEIPVDWEVKEISFFGNVITGKTPSTAKKMNYGKKYNFITIPDMHNKVFIEKTARQLSEEGHICQSNKLIPKNSIIVSCIATVGLVSIVLKEGHTNQQINSVIPYKDLYRIFLFSYLKQQKEYLNLLGSSGTTTKNVNKKMFETLKILKPRDKYLEQYENKLKPIFEQIQQNQQQNQTLKKQRDTLLPKLMSGEIRV